MHACKEEIFSAEAKPHGGEFETTFLWKGSHASFPTCISSHEKSLQLVQDGQLV